MEEPILDPQSRQDFPENFNTPKKGVWEWVMGHNFLVVGGILLMVLIVVAGLWFLRNRRDREPTNPNVVLSIKGPEKLASGNETEYRVIYTNGENADLINITLEVFYPSNFRFSSSEPEATSSNGQRFDLPVLRQGQSAEVIVKGKLSGATGEAKEMRARLAYKLSSFTSEFATEANYRTTLTAPELEMAITGPIDVMNGQTNTFTINYKNISGKDFDAMGIELKYP